MTASYTLLTLTLLTTALAAQSAFRFRTAMVERPAPEKAGKGGGGEDANYFNSNLIAVADGVGGWNTRGVDPSLYSKRLMKEVKDALASDPVRYIKDPKALAVIAANRDDVMGSSTLVIVSLDKDTGVLRTANIGDSGYMIIRKNVAKRYELVFKSEEQQHSFNFPFQIGTNGDNPNNAEVKQHTLKEGDVVIIGSDGLFDNMYNENILRIVNEVSARRGFTWATVADALMAETYKLSLDKSFMSPFAAHAKQNNLYFRGGKSDDITIVIGEVIIEKSGASDDRSNL